MKTYTIHLIRHALTQGNIEGRYIGQTDEELCQEGLNQLEVMKRDYNYPIADVVFTSSLKRCVQTAKILFPDKTPIEMRGFEECDFGEFRAVHKSLVANLRHPFGKFYALECATTLESACGQSRHCAIEHDATHIVLIGVVNYCGTKASQSLGLYGVAVG